MEKIENKIKWYKNKYTWIFIAIMIVAIAIRFYYFWMTKSQPIWWDESQYMAVAKTYAGQGFESLAGQRLPGFPLFMSSFFALGVQNEALIRFFACFLPSIILLVAIYFTISKMYLDKRIALISVAIMAVLWESLFYSNRFQTENFGMIFQMLAILSMYIFLNKQKLGKIIWLGIIASFTIIAVLFRPGQMLFIPAMILFLMIASWKEHKKWVIGLLTITILLGIGLMLIPSFNYIIQSNMGLERPMAWNSITVFEGFLDPILNIFFYIGIIIGICILHKKEGQEKKADIFNLLFIGTVLAAFIFIIRAPAFEYRWFFPLITGMLVFTAKGIIDVCDGFSSLFGKSGKILSVILIIIILSFGLYGQLSHADIIIKQKLTSYGDVRTAALWMKDNSVKNDIIFSISKPQTAYYSERKVISYSDMNNSDQMNAFVIENSPKYITISIFEPHPSWTEEWIIQNKNIISPIAAWFADQAKTQPTIVVYLTNLPAKESKESCDVEADTCKV